MSRKATLSYTVGGLAGGWLLLSRLYELAFQGVSGLGVILMLAAFAGSVVLLHVGLAGLVTLLTPRSGGGDS